MTNLLLGVTLTTAGSLTPINPHLANDDSLVTGSTYTPAGVYSGGEAGYWIADLGDDADVTSIEAYMSELAPNYRVWSSDDGSSWTLRGGIADWDLIGPGALYEIPLTVTARYWRLGWIAGGGYDGGNYLAEWRVIGEYSSGSVVDPSDPPPFVPDPPGGPILEIYTADPDGPRWGVATWGNAAWAAGGWQDVTPQGVMADVAWGTDDPSSGILARPAAGSWTVTTYDPDGDLDPANPTSPFVTYLVEGLPIRISHRGRVLRTGWVESITYSYATLTGRIRATDAIGRLRAMVADGALSETTLWARAQEAITAAGLDVGIRRGRPDNDAPLSDPPTGRRSAWDHIYLASQEVLAIVWTYPDGRLAWRWWGAPLERGRVLADEELIDLVAVQDGRGTYSVVRALDDDGVTTTERAFTPTPPWGKRVYERDVTTIESEGWCEAVLADRSAHSVRFIPGEIRPLTADQVEYYAELEAGEIVTIEGGAETTSGRILGGRFRVWYGVIPTLGLDGTAQPTWRFQFQVARADASVLVSDQAGDPLVADQDSTEFLIPG